ncbi:MAG: response regulator [Syntrophales bacterium]|jgi:two-component system, chemotaxis family, chemotaxis protein CheY
MSFNVLIVDDSKSVRSVIKKIITISGFRMDRCYEAVNGKQALDILSKEWVDIILSDLNMPEMNGLEMLAAIKADRHLQKIPVIVISTEDSDDKRHAVLEMGAKRFIKKPFSPEYVRKVLYEVIGMEDEKIHERDERDNDGSDF